MISAQQMTKALFVIERAGLTAVREGQSLVWHELVSEAVPMADGDDLMAAVKRLAIQRTSERGGSWLTVGDLIAQLRTVRRSRIEAEEKHQRQIESGSVVSSIDVARLMADARKGLPPEEVARRARERAEKATKAAREEA